MDNNEVIDILCKIAPPRTSKKAFDDFMEARDMAIAALEQTLSPANDDLIQKIEEGIQATTPTDEYMVGMRNGMKWCRSLLDGKEPKYDIVPQRYKKRRR